MEGKYLFRYHGVSEAITAIIKGRIDLGRDLLVARWPIREQKYINRKLTQKLDQFGPQGIIINQKLCFIRYQIYW